METAFEKAKRINREKAEKEKEAPMKEVADTVEENITEEHSLTTTAPRDLAVTAGVPIGGLEELPISMLTWPYVVITQALSDVYLADGKTPAPKGEWYATDTKTTTKELSFIILRAKVIQKEIVADDGQLRQVSKLRVLCVNVETQELFIFSLPVSSFNSWGSMMAQLKKIGVKNSYEYVITGTIKQQTNKKGQKYFVADFVIADKLAKEDLVTMQEKLGQFGGALDTIITDEEV